MKKIRKIVIFGTGAAAELAWYYFTHDSAYTVAGFSVDKRCRNTDIFCSLPVVDFETVENFFPPLDHSLFVAVGYAKMNAFRAGKVHQAQKKRYRLANYISTRATVFPDLTHVQNCFVLENNVIQPFVTIGSNVTIWSGSHIGHHSIIGDNTFISSQVVVSGGVRVGKNCFMGVNATVFEHLTISDYTLVAAGALINKDTEPYGVYIGAPARKTQKPSTALQISV
jgi:sugar O-acyltransferase (sialic acid O-acetyltransferase NeuD family)